MSVAGKGRLGEGSVYFPVARGGWWGPKVPDGFCSAGLMPLSEWGKRPWSLHPEHARPATESGWIPAQAQWLRESAWGRLPPGPEEKLFSETAAP